MNFDRLNFRAWNTVSLTDDEDNNYEKSFMLYNVDPFKGYVVGIRYEDFEDQLEKQGFSEDEIKLIRQDYGTEFCDDYLNIDVDEIDQCTGIKDANDKLVFEGDILSDYDGFKILVRCDDLELKYEFIPVLENNTEDLDIYPNECEVIGNIHENPELVK